MRVDSPGFGSLEVETNRLIEFPLGLPGFEQCRHFAFGEIEKAGNAVALLQSVEDPGASFSVTTPEVMGLHYEFELSAEELALLEVDRPDDIVVLLMVRKADGEALGAPVQANLTAPLVINIANRKGLQKVIARLGCELTLKAL